MAWLRSVEGMFDINHKTHWWRMREYTALVVVIHAVLLSSVSDWWSPSNRRMKTSRRPCLVSKKPLQFSLNNSGGSVTAEGEQPSSEIKQKSTVYGEGNLTVTPHTRSKDSEVCSLNVGLSSAKKSSKVPEDFMTPSQLFPFLFVFVLN